jgi:hypothetical protein
LKIGAFRDFWETDEIKLLIDYLIFYVPFERSGGQKRLILYVEWSDYLPFGWVKLSNY